MSAQGQNADQAGHSLRQGRPGALGPRCGLLQEPRPPRDCDNRMVPGVVRWCCRDRGARGRNSGPKAEGAAYFCSPRRLNAHDVNGRRAFVADQGPVCIHDHRNVLVGHDLHAHAAIWPTMATMYPMRSLFFGSLRQ